MEKIFVLLYRAPSLTREEFARRYLEAHAPLVLQHCPRLRRYAVNVVQKDTEGFDVAVELQTDSVEDFLDKERLYDTPDGRAAVKESAAKLESRRTVYLVDERVQRDYERAWPDGEPSPGLKLVAPLSRVNGLTHEQFVDHWTNTHSELALKHVLGMGRYVTNVVVRPLTPDAPEIDGIVEVHYTGKREFDSPEGERTMIEDTQGLLQTPTRHMAVEYILRS